MDFGAKKPAAAPMFGAQKPAAPAGDLVKDTTTAGFAKDVIEASKQALVLVDFWAAWCQPCKQLTPIIEKVVRSYNGKVRLVKINIDEHRMIAEQLRVQNLPTVYAFKDGRPVDGFMGMQTEAQVKAFIDRLIGEDEAIDLQAALDAAAKAFDEGQLQEAVEIYAAVLEEDAQNVGALAGLARCYLAAGDLVRAEETLALVPPTKLQSAAVSSVRAGIDLAKRGSQVGDWVALSDKVLVDPTNHQLRLDYALALAAGGRKDDAVEELLTIFRRDRNWNEGEARKQLVTLFEAWGPKDSATIDGRKRLSSLMFA